jgi:hypothetical protein
MTFKDLAEHLNKFHGILGCRGTQVENHCSKEFKFCFPSFLLSFRFPVFAEIVPNPGRLFHYSVEKILLISFSSWE